MSVSMSTTGMDGVGYYVINIIIIIVGQILFRVTNRQFLPFSTHIP